MKGAEIALVGGLRVRVGSGADCDIVLADVTLPETAFELDVSADAVSLVRGDDVRALVPFEVFAAGTSAFAIGPAEGAWEPLNTGGDAPKEAERRTEEAGTEEAGASGEEGVPPPPGPGERASGRRRGILVWCCALAGLLVVLVLLAVWIRGERASREERAVPAESRPTLADIASQYGLLLTNCTLDSANLPSSSVGYPLLKGNLARRTERLAIRSLAQSADPRVKLELTDDETLSSAAEELLFVVTEGAVKVASATNGVVTLVGYAPSVDSLERTIRALDADVRGIRRVVTAQVAVGGPPPVDKTQAIPEKPVAQAPRSRGTKTNPVRDYPISGILTKPYPMVVLNNGMRLVEGAQIADVIVERIEADRLIMRQGATVFEWKP